MSQDGTVVVLGTKSHRRKDPSGYSESYPERMVYRVEFVQAWDNFKWYKENQPYNVGAYLSETFGHCYIFEDFLNAMRKANQIADEIGYVEYGICVVETDYVFYNE